MGADIFPELDNPFKVSLGEMAGNIYNAVIPPQINNNTGFLNQSNVSIPNTTINFDQLNLDQKINKSTNLDSFIKP